jgi:hypothetical protein
MTQIILTIIFYIWLFLVVFLLWRHAVGAGAQSRKVTVLLAESSQKSAEAAHKAAEAVWKIADMMEEKEKYDH